MSTHERGIYESIITEAIAAKLNTLGKDVTAVRSKLRTSEAADRLSMLLGQITKRAIESLKDEERVVNAIELVRTIIDQIGNFTSDLVEGEKPDPNGEVLDAILTHRPDGSVETIEAPLIPLMDTTLLTNAPGEPRVGHQLLTEVHSANRIDLVMAFIRKTGITPLIGALKDHCARGFPLRIITTTYTNSTEASALELLHKAGAEIRVSYDTSTTRLHAKAWMFHRASGFSTAYIGSSNLTHSAQVSGLEWNVRVSGARNRDVIDKVSAVFESYWNSNDFMPYNYDEFLARTTKAEVSAPHIFMSPIEVRLEPFQERLLEQIELSRQQGRHKNLLVSATGTGKTVMAAVDFARLSAKFPRASLLFVAHREEILSQTLAIFRHCLRDHAFGELWVAGNKPKKFEHVFASIQSLSTTGFASLAPDHFDIVIVDEFHHAAAPSYKSLLDHVNPIELLGLTATPERSDGLSLLDWFGNRIAAELRIWDAIDQHRLCPFAYYGIHDGMNFQQVQWRRGQGYDINEITEIYCSSDSWAKHVIIDCLINNDTQRLLEDCV